MTPSPDGFDDAGRFAADAARQRNLVDAAAVIGVDVVEADHLVAHPDLSRARRRQISTSSHFITSGRTLFVDSNRFGKVSPL